MKRVGAVRFSVVIPCHNEADYISQALRSLKAQETTANYEIVVVDNNCSDATSDIAKSFGARVITEKQPGVCAARQAGTKAARGEIIISTDADTVFSPHWLQNIDNAFRSQPDLIALGGPCRYYDGPLWGKAYTHLLFGLSWLHAKIFGYPFYVTATNIAFKKSVWSGYDLSLMQGGDELGLLHELRVHGKVGFNNTNATLTSGRRLKRGLAYNVFVTFLFYYLAGFYLNSLFKRTIIGQAPAFRKTYRVAMVPRFVVGVFVLCAMSFMVYGIRSGGFMNSADNIRDMTAYLEKLF